MSREWVDRYEAALLVKLEAEQALPAWSEPGPVEPLVPLSALLEHARRVDEAVRRVERSQARRERHRLYDAHRQQQERLRRQRRNAA